jgi:tetratricopeptide (TPR) repeat protein
MGRHEEALNESKIAQQFDPLSPNFPANIAWTLYIAERFNEAEAQLEEVIKRDPNYARAYTTLGEIYTAEGKFNEAHEVIQKAKRLSADIQTETITAYLYAVSGRTAEASKLAATLESKAQKKELQAFLMAEVYAGLNDLDKSFYWLERAFQERSNWLVFSKVSPRLNSFIRIHDIRIY